MKTLIIVNLTDGNEAALKRLDGRTVLTRVLEYAAALVPREDVLLLLKEALPETEVKSVLRETWSEAELFTVLKAASGGYDDIIYVYGDAPFLDAGLTEKMLKNHRTYFAEYSFADGFPYGLSPEIIKTRILPALEALIREPKSPVKRDTIFTVLQRDINAFDVETELSREDLRLLRVSLTTDTKRNHRLVESLSACGPKNYDAIVDLLKNRPELLRTLPAFIQVQLTDGCPQACFSCPFPKFGGDILSKRGSMPVELFERIAGQTAAFSGDAAIGVSLWGEPSFHPEFTKLCGIIERYPGLELLVETSGLGWTDEVLKEVRDILGDRVSWILSLDGTDEKSYARLRGKGWEEAKKRAEDLVGLFPSTAYVQALRMNENEDALETFYRAWKEKTPNVIIQKYDYFSGFLEQRKVTDLSPLKRFPCWHLKRDLTVLMDGTVPLCREDLEKRHVLGNLSSEDLPAVWERGFEVYRSHINENYSDLCGRCDEYYTYNF